MHIQAPRLWFLTEIVIGCRVAEFLQADHQTEVSCVLPMVSMKHSAFGQLLGGIPHNMETRELPGVEELFSSYRIVVDIQDPLPVGGAT